MGAAGARRPVSGARGVRDAGAAPGPGLPLGLRLQRRQPRCDARPADPRLGRARGRAVPHGGRRSHARRSQGRAPRAAGGRGGARPARGRADARGGPRRLPGHHAPPLLQHEHAVARPRARRRGPRRRRGHRPADDHQPQDGGPGGPGLAARRPAGDGDGRGDRELPGRTRPAGAALPVPAGEDDRRPARAALRRLRAGRALARRRGARRAAAAQPPLVRLDPDWFRLVDEFDARFPAGPAVARGLRLADRRGRRAVRPRTSSCAAPSRSPRTGTRRASSTTAPCSRADRRRRARPDRRSRPRRRPPRGRVRRRPHRSRRASARPARRPVAPAARRPADRRRLRRPARPRLAAAARAPRRGRRGHRLLPQHPLAGRGSPRRCGGSSASRAPCPHRC